MEEACDSVILFPGVPSEPKCKFSRQAVDILKMHHIPFSSFNILSDDSVRQGLKKFSNWPTYPQLYVGGKLLGGLDILKEMVEEGELVRLWVDAGFLNDLVTSAFR